MGAVSHVVFVFTQSGLREVSADEMRDSRGDGGSSLSVRGTREENYYGFWCDVVWRWGPLCDESGSGGGCST